MKAEKMNKPLEEYAKLTDIKCINIYNKLIDESGERKRKYIFDDVHFNKKIIPHIFENINTLNKN